MDITIVGAGKLGTELANCLSNEDHNVTLVDTNAQRLSKLVEKYDIQAVCGSGTHIDIMKEAQADIADLVISTTHSDENNILVCLIAKKLGAKNTIARVRNPEYNDQFEFMRNELGISFMINPDFSAALEISRILQFPDVSNIETFANGHIDMAEYKITEASELCGKSISSISIGKNNDMLICAVERDGEVYIPNGDFILKAKDRIHITGKHKELAKIGRTFSNAKRHLLKNIMIIGCSRTSVYLADMLVAMGRNVIIVDKDLEKCNLLFDMVPDATVLNGDANDHDFLVGEGLKKMDAVITLTDIDETNFLVSLYADKVGVPKTITKINNSNLSKMLDDIGLDTIINVSEISVSTITQYVRARKNVISSYMKTLYKLVGGKVEATEFLAGDYVSFLGTPLSKLKLRKNVLVAAINRKNQTIFPSGNDTIENGDLVVVVSKDMRIANLNDILQ